MTTNEDAMSMLTFQPITNSTKMKAALAALANYFKEHPDEQPDGMWAFQLYKITEAPHTKGVVGLTLLMGYVNGAPWVFRFHNGKVLPGDGLGPKNFLKYPTHH